MTKNNICEIINHSEEQKKKKKHCLLHNKQRLQILLLNTVVYKLCRSANIICKDIQTLYAL